MKKLILTAALALAVVSAYSQGTVLWGNSGTTLVSTNSYSGQGTAPPGSPTGVTAPSAGLGYVYGLFVAANGTTLGGMNNAAWTFTGLYATNTTAVSGGRIGVPGLGAVPDSLAGTTVALQVRGWSASFGKDWTAVKAWGNADAGGVLNVASTGWYGESAIGTALLGGGAIGNPTLFGASAGQIGGFVLNQVNPIPEPSTFALAGLAGAALLIFRRRK